MILRHQTTNEKLPSRCSAPPGSRDSRRSVSQSCAVRVFSNRVSRYPHQKTRQPVSGENYPTVCNPACVNDMPHGKHRGRRYSLAIPISTPRRTDSPAITISDLRRNLVALLCPSLKVSVGKFGELAPLKLLTASKCRRVVSESREILA